MVYDSRDNEEEREGMEAVLAVARSRVRIHDDNVMAEMSDTQAAKKARVSELPESAPAGGQHTESAPAGGQATESQQKLDEFS